jgi:predicted metal-dependent hydrolase
MEPTFFPCLDRGIDLFNKEKFFEAHEAWEDAWRLEKGEPAHFLHGLIQVAAGFVKLQRGEPKGTVALLAKGAAKLERFLPGRYGVDLQDLLASAARWRREAAEMLASGTTGFDPPALPRLARARPSPDRHSGTPACGD